MAKKKDGDPKKALMAKPKTKQVMITSGSKGYAADAAKISGSKYPSSTKDSLLKSTAKSIMPTAPMGGQRRGDVLKRTYEKVSVKVPSTPSNTGMKGPKAPVMNNRPAVRSGAVESLKQEAMQRLKTSPTPVKKKNN